MMKYAPYSLALILATLFLSTAPPASATVPFDGYLIADKECPALHSIRKETNPGNIMLEPDKAYLVTGKNKVQATHYQIQLKDVDTPQRWVEISCGTLLTDCKVCGAEEEVKEPSQAEYLLAISWQPGFCQHKQSKTECQTQTEDRYDATHLTLHGLWPQPKGNAYCGVSNKDKTIDRNKHWNLLPEVKVSDSTATALAIAMPGIASYLDRHEWIKHGTCYDGASQDEYFKESLMLLGQVNESAVQQLFADNIGKDITSQAIRAAFDKDFGEGAGKKVQVKCSGKLITELWINLRGEINNDTKLEDLLKDADNAKKGCDEGTVDPVGF